MFPWVLVFLMVSGLKSALFLKKKEGISYKEIKSPSHCVASVAKDAKPERTEVLALLE